MLPWASFLQRYRPVARAIAETLLGPGGDADDLVQEAALSLYAAWRKDPARFETTEHARNYYLRTVRNLAARSRERQRPTTVLAEDPPDCSTSASQAAELEARRTHLGRLLRSLPHADRELVARRFLRRETLAQVSLATGVPVSTLHNRERGILKRLREEVQGIEALENGESSE